MSEQVTQCRGTARSGKQCRRHVNIHWKGSYCKAHQHQYPYKCSRCRTELQKDQIKISILALGLYCKTCL